MRLKAPHPPRCPFCDSRIDPPVELEPKRLGDFAYGRCKCGAVYVYDVTGHNLGAAFVEALGYGTGFDWDLAWELTPQTDYEERHVQQYDLHTHLIHPSGRTEDERRVKGVLLFLKFSDEIMGLKGKNTQHPAPKEQKPPSTHKNHKKGAIRKGSFSKREIKKAIDSEGYLKKIFDMAEQDPKVLNRLQQLLYTPDHVARWRAIESIGVAARAVYDYRPGFVGEFLRRLLYSASDSAATNWGAIEAAGEIIRNIPSTFDLFIRELLALMRFDDSQLSVLIALERIAETQPRSVKDKAFFSLIGLLESKSPAIRGLALRILGMVGAKECMGAIERLTKDDAAFSIHTKAGEQEFTVSTLATQAIRRIKGESSIMKDIEQNQRLKDAHNIFQEAEVLFNQGRSLDAIDKYEEALGIFEEEGFEKGIANVCEKLGDLHCFRGNLSKALPLYQRALTICHKSNDPISEVIVLEKIIDLYRRQDKQEQCLPYYLRALELAEATGDAGKAGYYLTGLGDVYQRRGEMEKALDAYKTAHNIFVKTRHMERARIIEQGIARIQQMLDQ